MADTQEEHTRFAAIFAGGTMISRVLGLARDLLWTTLIPGASFDAFIVALRLPNMLRDLFGEGATNAAFVPVFSETLEKRGDEEFRELVSAAMSAMLVLLGLLTVIGLFLLPTLLSALDFMHVFTQREHVPPERIELMTTLALWTFPYLFLIGMAIFMSGPLYAVKHYLTPSWTPALLNVSLIATCLLFHKRFDEPAYALVIGVWLGGTAHMLVQYIALGKITGVWRPNFKLGHPDIKRIFMLMIPIIIGQAAWEVNRMVDMLFAASLEEGTIRSLFLSNRLIQLPLSIFGVATAVAILPGMARAGARKDTAGMHEMLLSGLRQSYFLILPSMIGLIVMGEPIVKLLFERGYFDAAATERTSTALIIYAAGLLSFTWVKVLVTGFHAEMNTRTPVIIASASMLFNVLLNFALIAPLGYKGLAIATTISYTLNAGFLYLFLWNKFGSMYNAAFGSALLRITLATLLMAAVTYVVRLNIVNLVPGDTLIPRTIHVLVPMTAAVASYLGFSAALKVEEFQSYLAILKRKTGGK